MPEYSLSSATTTDFTNQVPDFIIESISLDAVNPNSEETYWYFKDARKYFGYSLSISEIFNAASALCTWAYSRGYETEDILAKQDLEHVTGNGKQTFGQIIWQHGFTKLTQGDAFMEIKRPSLGTKIQKIFSANKPNFVNLIPISPERVRIVFEKSGRIKRYDVWNGGEWRAIKRENMFHSSNKLMCDSMCGTSQLKPSLKTIDAINEALDDERVIKHRDKALGIVYYKTSNTGKITYANTQIEKAVKNGEMLGLAEETAKIEPYPSRSSEDRSNWISLLQNKFYQDFGVPRSIASSDGTSEVGGKMGHVIFEPIYSKEQKDMEDDFYAQLGIKIKFNRPPSLGGLVQEEERKNSGQTNIQPNDSVVNLNRE